MDNKEIVIVTLLSILLVAVIVFFGFTPGGRAVFNEYRTNMKKVDDATAYETRKHVEDSCRSMMASYTSDKLTYDQYKDSESKEKQGWAEQAKMRANKTAASYNEYILKNSFVWEGNVPADIKSSLPYVE